MTIWKSKDEAPQGEGSVFIEIRGETGSFVIASDTLNMIFFNFVRWCWEKDLLAQDKRVEELEEKLDIEEKNSLAFQRAYLEMQDKYSKQTRELDIYQKSSSSKQKTIESTQKKLDIAVKALEFYAKAKHFEEHSYYDIMLEWGEKARETLEIIDKE